MAEKIYINSYEKLWQKINELEKSKITFFLYFTGSTDKNGVSWCSDCNAAKPFIEKYVAKLPSNLKIIFVDVGGRDDFKNPESKFKKDSKLNVKKVPTLYKWGVVNQQLTEGELISEDMLTLFFEDYL